MAKFMVAKIAVFLAAILVVSLPASASGAVYAKECDKYTKASDARIVACDNYVRAVKEHLVPFYRYGRSKDSILEGTMRNLLFESYTDKAFDKLLNRTSTWPRGTQRVITSKVTVLSVKIKGKLAFVSTRERWLVRARPSKHYPKGKQLWLDYGKTTHSATLYMNNFKVGFMK